MRCGLDVLADHFGVGRVEEVVVALMAAGPSELASAEDALLHFNWYSLQRLGRRLFPPELQKNPGELRPFVGVDALRPPVIPRNIEEAHLAAEKILVRLQHMLLYAHSIATEEPVPHVRVDQFDTADERRLSLISYAVVMTYIYPLVQADVIILAEPSLSWHECGPLHAPIHWDDCTASQFGALDAVAAWHPDPIGRIDELVYDLYRACIFDGWIDLHLRDALELPLLAWIFGEDQRTIAPRRHLVLPETIADDELLVAQVLLTLQVPGVANLCPQDLVAIRQSDEAFASWRRALRSGVAASLALPSVLDRHGGTLRRVQGEAEHEARQLFRTFGRSKFLADRTNGIRDFGVQAVLGATTGTSIASAAISGARAAGKLVVSSLANRRKPSEAAFESHIEALHYRAPG